MKLILATFVLAIVIGRLAGGSISGLERLRVRLPILALVGLVLQLLVPPGQWPLALLMISFVLLIVFASVNIELPGIPLIAVGIALNFLVIGVNHGMPVTKQSIVASGQEDTLHDLITNPGAKHHLAGPGDRLMFLGDVITIPRPIGQVVSVGDLVTYGGVGLMIVAAMRRREASPGEGSGSNRGSGAEEASVARG